MPAVHNLYLKSLCSRNSFSKCHCTRTMVQHPLKVRTMYFLVLEYF